MSGSKPNLKIISQLRCNIEKNMKILSERKDFVYTETLDEELETYLMKKSLLKVQEDNIKQEINETATKMKEYTCKCQELQRVKLPETEWLQTRTQIHLENEKVTINYHKNKMNAHVESWLQNHSSPKKEPEETNEMSSSNLQWNSGMSDDLPIKLELEAQAAEISLKKAECLEKIDNEQKRAKILANRNKAYMLKLRKDLQKSEVQRKEVIKRCEQIKENMKKIEKQQYH